MPTQVHFDAQKSNSPSVNTLEKANNNSSLKINGAIHKSYTLSSSMMVIMCLLFSTSIYSQTLVELISATNPLLGMQASSLNSSIRFADLDADGDMDGFVGSANGLIEYFRNDGTKTVPQFNLVGGSDNPFDGIIAPTGHATIGFTDIDGDGDLDAFLGDEDGDLYFYRNTGTTSLPTFTLITGAANPLDGVNEGLFSNVFFGDLDGDGDVDAIIGNEAGMVSYYQNNGSVTAPVFVKQLGLANPFNGEDMGDHSYGVLADPDNDGDLDAFFGNENGNIKAYANIGTPLVPGFLELTGTFDPFSLINIGRSTPEWVDIDGDGDLDFFSGEDSGDFEYMQNAFTFNCMNLSQQPAVSNPLNGIEATTISSSSVAFCDFDNDGDEDAIVGSLNLGLFYYENIGTKIAPNFNYIGGTLDAASPFFGMVFGQTSMPATVDIDGDGDCDIFVGRTLGSIQYIRNDGGFNFVMVAGASNPFNGVDVGQRSAPTFGDIDGDGDQDCFIGEQAGTVFYYKNIGDAANPSFSSFVGSGNPLNIASVLHATPTLVDIDKDGDLDAFIGRFNGIIKYYKNEGNANTPFFALIAGTDNPFSGVDIGNNANIGFVDLDCNGSFDAFLGGSNGELGYWKGEDCSPLPVELAYFHATLKDNSVVLSWMTASEANNEGFEVQHSIDGRNWDAIDFINGAGDSNEPIVYDNLHQEPVVGTNYYRLKQMDFDGVFEYSSVRVIELEGKGNFNAYPNPVRDVLNIELPYSEEVTISVYSLNGQLMKQEITTASRLALDFSELQAGIYVMKLVGTNTQIVQKVIKD